MTHSQSERFLLVALRLVMAWIFLYAASQQVFVPGWSVVGFLDSTKTFHPLYSQFTGPVVAPVLSFLVAYGHLLIGLSLLLGLLVRVSTVFGILLMFIYWTAHMDFPYISNTLSFLVDEHVVYAVVLAFLFVEKAGHILGLDTWAENLNFFRQHPNLRPLVA
jgi:thiosulfate dehydrogenase [quinone] large subunit